MNKKKLKPWILLLPCIIIMVSLVLIPVIRTFFFSLQNYTLTSPETTKFIFFDNYLKLIKNHDFWYAFQNSMIILVFVVIFSMISSISVGLLLNKNSRFSGLLTAIAILPWALPPIVNGIIWKFIFYPGNGFANKLLMVMGLIDKPIAWTNSRMLVLFVVSVVVSWRVVPFCAIIVLANLQNIPGELYEAAKVDGSSKLQELTKITLPMLIPSFSIILIQITMAAINVFDEIVAIAGYKFESQTLLIYNYLNTFSFLDFGYGSAISYSIMIISGIIGYFYIKTMSDGSYE